MALKATRETAVKSRLSRKIRPRFRLLMEATTREPARQKSPAGMAAWPDPFQRVIRPSARFDPDRSNFPFVNLGDVHEIITFSPSGMRKRINS